MADTVRVHSEVGDGLLGGGGGAVFSNGIPLFMDDLFRWGKMSSFVRALILLTVSCFYSSIG